MLITISKTKIGTEINSVNARELHNFLESKQDYTTWIKNRIKKYGFTENEDYILIFSKKEGNNATLKDYYITLDMAKELAMVENNQKGKEARRYFLDIEKKYIQSLKDTQQNTQPLSNLTHIKTSTTLTINTLTYYLNEFEKIDKIISINHNTINTLTNQLTQTKQELDELKKVHNEAIYSYERYGDLLADDAEIHNNFLSFLFQATQVKSDLDRVLSHSPNKSIKNSFESMASFLQLIEDRYTYIKGVNQILALSKGN